MFRKESKVGCENIKIMLYRAIQDVPWCKVTYFKLSNFESLGF